MRAWLKWAVVLLGIAMMGAALTACQKEEPSAAEATGSGPTNSQRTAPSADAAAAENLPPEHDPAGESSSSPSPMESPPADSSRESVGQAVASSEEDSSSSVVLAETAPEAFADSAEKGLVHRDEFELNGNDFELFYWNDGEFDYTRFTILKNQTVAFDSHKEGIEIEAGESQADGTWAEALVQDDRAAFIFSLGDNRPNAATLIVEDFPEGMKVTVHDKVGAWFEPIGDSGSSSLIGQLYYGQIPLSPGPQIAYVWDNGEYVPQRDLTREYWEGRLRIESEAFLEQPDIFSLDPVISAYLVLDRLDDARKWLVDYMNTIDVPNSSNSYLWDYERYLNDPEMLGAIDYQQLIAYDEPLRQTNLTFP